MTKSFRLRKNRPPEITSLETGGFNITFVNFSLCCVLRNLRLH